MVAAVVLQLAGAVLAVAGVYLLAGFGWAVIACALVFGGGGLIVEHAVRQPHGDG